MKVAVEVPDNTEGMYINLILHDNAGGLMSKTVNIPLSDMEIISEDDRK